MNLEFMLAPSERTLAALAGIPVLEQSFARFQYDNKNTLHCLVVPLGTSLRFEPTYRFSRELCSLMRTLLELGADPLLVSSDDFPFLSFLREVNSLGPFDAEVLLYLVRQWAEIFYEAGIDLCSYGRSEREIWRYQEGFPWLCWDKSGWITNRLLFEEHSDDCSIQMQHFETIVIFEVQSLPGAWPTCPAIPQKICWCPGMKERDDGVWVEVYSRVIPSPSKDARKF